MKGYLLAVTVASSLALAMAAGCGSSSGGSGGTSGSGSSGTKGSGGSDGSGSGGGFNCDYKVGPYEYCYSYTGLTSSQMSAEQTACKAESGATTPSSCSTKNQSGCCEKIPLTGSSITYGYCTYGVPSADVSALKTACTTSKGTWNN
jgi:hypothetical protein